MTLPSACSSQQAMYFILFKMAGSKGGMSSETSFRSRAGMASDPLAMLGLILWRNSKWPSSETPKCFIGR